MPEASLLSAVNKNYLEKVIDLAEDADVVTTDDIYDVRGMKLIAKGAKISRAMQEKLILHKLSKPLESNLRVEGGVDIRTVLQQARHISETLEPVSCMLKAIKLGGPTPFQILQDARIGNAMSLMLTITERGGESALAHSVIVSLVSICLGKQIGMNESDLMAVALGGLLHDIGELYIEPEYLSSKRVLLPHEWRHVVIHPRIGQMLINELEDYPDAVSQAVSEHHERFDGSGYPRQTTGKGISLAGQVLSVAEMVSGVFMKRDRPLERAELALKIIPGEHASGLISAISRTLRVTPSTGQPSSDMTADDAHHKVRGIFGRISTSIDASRELLDSTTVKSKPGKDLLLRALNQIHTIQRAFSSTGLYVCMEQDSSLFDSHNLEILFEAAVATREIQWRLRDVARSIALQSTLLESHETEVFQPLILLLDRDS